MRFLLLVLILVAVVVIGASLVSMMANSVNAAGQSVALAANSISNTITQCLLGVMVLVALLAGLFLGGNLALLAGRLTRFGSRALSAVGRGKTPVNTVHPASLRRSQLPAPTLQAQTPRISVPVVVQDDDDEDEVDFFPDGWGW